MRKLIIEIPEYNLNDVQNGSIACSQILKAVKNGTPFDKNPQGEWIIDGHHFKCSRCGKTLAIMFSETDEDDLIGCPFCLADMRGGRQ